MRKKITISDVAKVAGVSETTVSRVMSGTGRISERTRERVFSVIDKLDYQPSAIAKGLIEAKTYNVGLILSSEANDYKCFENNFFIQFIQGAVIALKKYQYDLVVTYGDENDIKTLNRFIKRQKAEGIILLKAYKHSEHINMLKKIAFPFVVAGLPDDQSVPYIDFDDNNTICELVDKFTLRCDNRIGFMATDNLLNLNLNKIKRLKNCIEQKGLQFIDSYIYTGDNYFDRQQYLNNFIGNKTKNRALITADYNSLLYALDYFKANNIRIPDDVQLITYNDNAILALHSPSISAIDLRARSLGENASNMLMSVITRTQYKNEINTENLITYRDSTF